MGQTRYSVEGLNLNYLIDKLHRNNITLIDIDKTSDKKLLFSVKNSDNHKLVALLKDSCYNIITEKQTGKPVMLRFLLKRMALFIGVAVFLFTSLYYGSAVRKITYYDDAVEYSQTISEILKERNAGVGKRNIDTKEISNYILSKVPEFVFVSVHLEGVNLNISAIAKDSLTNLNKDADCDIVSEFDGVITKMFVLSGTPVVKIGDSVIKGQTLIKGRIGPEENSSKVLAIGEVYGVVDVVYTEYYETVLDVPYKTGDYYTVTKLKLFNMLFPAKSKEAKEFENFETEILTEDLFTDLILPFKRITEVYYEVKFQQVERDFDKISSIIIDEAKKKALGLIDTNMTVIDTKVTVTDEVNKKLITVVLNCEKKMSQVQYNNTANK